MRTISPRLELALLLTCAALIAASACSADQPASQPDPPARQAAFITPESYDARLTTVAYPFRGPVSSP